MIYLFSRGYIQECGWAIELCDVKDFESADIFNEYVMRRNVAAIFIIHAYRAGRLMTGICVV